MQYVKVHCPNPEHEDSNPSCALYANGSAFCFSRCGFIPAYQIQEWLGDNYAEMVAEARNAPQVTHTPTSPSGDQAYRFVLLSHATLFTGPRQARKEWLYQRGLTERTCRRYKFGHTGEHFVIPLWYDSEFRGYKLRRDDRYADPDEVKYKNPKGQKSVVIRPNPQGSPMVVTEGELDTYLLCQWGADAISSSSGAGSLATDIQFERLSKELYICTDMDDAGEDAARHIQAYHPGIRIRLPRGNDISDYLEGITNDQRGQALRDLFRNGA